jgi:hypothetical protein
MSDAGERDHGRDSAAKPGSRFTHLEEPGDWLNRKSYGSTGEFVSDIRAYRCRRKGRFAPGDGPTMRF